MAEFKIRDFVNTDLPSIISIANEELGKGYFEGVLNCEKHINQSILRVVEKDNNEIAGFCYAYFNPAESLTDILRPLSYGLKTGVLKTIVIKDRYKNNGLGKAFIDDMIEKLNLTQTQVVISTVWDNQFNPAIRIIMRHAGFKSYQEIPNYWTNDSIEKGYQCPVCGHPCFCSAIIYYKKL